MSDSESDHELMPPAFAVDGDPSGDGPPEDGLEYLRRVRAEAQQFPRVKVAKTRARSQPSTQTSAIAGLSFPQSHREHLPSPLWEKKLVADFSNLRQNFHLSLSTQAEDARAAMRAESLARNSFRGSGVSTITAAAAADAALTAAAASATPADADSAPAAAAGTERVAGVSGPLVSLVAALDMPCASRLLCYFDQVLQDDSGPLSLHRSQWLFALLARIEKPLTPRPVLQLQPKPLEVCGWMRSIVRRCVALRSELPVPCDEDRLAAVNIPITILAKYFNQASPEEVSSSDSTTQDEEA